MRPLARLTPEAARDIDTVVFDLDDTLLDHGRLTEVAYAALFRLRDAGLSLVASTGRPAGWAELIARQWPLVAALAENGAVAWSRAEGAAAAARRSAAERGARAPPRTPERDRRAAARALPRAGPGRRRRREKGCRY